jgi:negative regulator of flagellin synthesis FlgM
MKIDSTSITPIGSVQATNRLKQVSKNKSESDADKVAVSDKAQVYQSLLQKAKEVSDVRADRVKAISEQIERGEFKIDGQKIADKLLPFKF